MKYKLIYILFGSMILLDCSKSNKKMSENKKLEEIGLLDGWNTLTRNSLLLGIKNSSDSVQKKYYENRLAAFDVTQNPAKKSRRYGLLTTLLAVSPEYVVNATIVELTLSGEQVEFFAFVVPNKLKTVVIYKYMGGLWRKLGESDDDESVAKISIVRFGEGDNDFDLIISNTDSSGFSKSQYCLLSTLKNSSGLRKMLRNLHSN